MNSATNPQQKLAKILQTPSHQLSIVMDKVNQLTHLNQLFITLLDNKMAQHCQIANYKNNHLIVLVDSATWATRLRFLIPELTDQLKQFDEFHTLTTITHLVRPKNYHSHLPMLKKQKPVISDSNKQLLEATAHNIQDKKLKKALLKLCKG